MAFKVIDGLITKENPNGTGLVVINGLLGFWDEGALAGWTGKISGVTNPAKINGVVVTNISKVMGIS